MSILIKGMEMPKGLEMLVVFSDGTVHKCLPGMREYVEKGTAVPVPPHGRLGDLDRLEKELVFDYAYASAEICKAVPTVIEAEE